MAKAKTKEVLPLTEEKNVTWTQTGTTSMWLSLRKFAKQKGLRSEQDSVRVIITAYFNNNII